jgi:Domain of unknown function (DUF3291)
MDFRWTTVRRDEAGPDAVVLVTWFRLTSPRLSPAFMFHGLRLWRQARRSPGALGVSIGGDPFRGTFWTLSAWTDHKSLAAYTRTDPHGAAMARIRPWMKEFSRVFWTVPVADLPTRPRGAGALWADGRRRVAEDRDGHSAPNLENAPPDP